LYNDFQRLEKLHKNKDISKSQYDSAHKGYEAAKAMYEMADSKLSMALEGTRSEDLMIIEASLQSAKGRYTLAELTYNKTIIKSPINGFITSRNYEKKDYVLPASNPMGKELCGIINIDKLYFVCHINELYLKYVKLGEKININIPSFERTVEGKITIINPMGDKKNRNYMVKIEIENFDHRLKSGMFSLGNLVLEKAENIIIIPKDLVQDKKDDSGYVFINKNNIAIKKIVKLGITEGQNIEIIDGINLKDEIISEGIRTISEGVKINVLNRDGK
jgi:RND family efflux transporter MFP subunit